MVVSLRETQAIGASGVISSQEVSQAAASALIRTSSKLNASQHDVQHHHDFNVNELAHAVSVVGRGSATSVMDNVTRDPAELSGEPVSPSGTRAPAAPGTVKSR